MSRPEPRANTGSEYWLGIKGVWYQFGLILFISAFFAGCDLLPEEIIIPTLMPEDEVPTAIALTAQAMVTSRPSPTPIPPAHSPGPLPQEGTNTVDPNPTSDGGSLASSGTETPTPVISTPSPSPTYALEDLSPASLPTSLPYGDIQILNPGPLSKVISPLELHAYLYPGEDERVRVALYGEDGRLLVRRVVRYRSSPEEKVHIKLDLDFEIPRVAETARLEISTRDEYGRLTALSSTDVILLTEGEPDINPPLDLYEKTIIEEPIPNTLIQGGSVIVKGYTRYAERGQLLVEIVNFRGGVVGSKIIGVSDDELDLGYHFFAGEVPYQVGSATWVQVQVTARDHRLSGVQHTSSVRVLISP